MNGQEDEVQSDQGDFQETFDFLGIVGRPLDRGNIFNLIHQRSTSDSGAKIKIGMIG